MFAQLYVDRKSKEFKPEFAIACEKPILRGFIISIIAGTVLGGYFTAVVLMHSMSLISLIGAIAAGAAVGATAGQLIYGLGDVIFNGRLEEGADLVEDAEGSELFSTEIDTSEKMPEEAGQEDYAFTLPKAS